MMALLAPLIPYLAAIIGAVVGWFAIRQTGVVAERQRQEAKQAEVKAKVEAKLDEAKTADVAIDKKVEAKVEAIKQEHAQPTGTAGNGDTFRF